MKLLIFTTKLVIDVIIFLGNLENPDLLKMILFPHFVQVQTSEQTIFIFVIWGKSRFPSIITLTTGDYLIGLWTLFFVGLAIQDVFLLPHILYEGKGVVYFLYITL